MSTVTNYIIIIVFTVHFRGHRISGVPCDASHPRRIRQVHSPTTNPTVGATGKAKSTNPKTGATGAVGVVRRPSVSIAATDRRAIGVSTRDRGIPTATVVSTRSSGGLPTATVVPICSCGGVPTSTIVPTGRPGVSTVGRVPTTGTIVSTRTRQSTSRTPTQSSVQAQVSEQTGKTGRRRERQ